MPTLAEVQTAVSKGLSFPCAMCSHHWSAKDRGQEHCGVATCGGPLIGRTFPDYSGPLPGGDWSHFCFVTGKPNNLVGVRVIGGKRMLAVAEEQQSVLRARRSSSAIDCTPQAGVLLISQKVGSDPRLAEPGHR